MKRLDRYLISELIVPFLVGTLAVVLMFQANLLIAQMKYLQLQHVPATAILQVILYKTPFFLNMTLPVGTSLAASLAISRLARETELTAMRSAGVSIRRVVLPIALFGALVGIGNYYLVEKVVPPAEKRAGKTLRELGILSASPEFQANAVIYLKRGAASFGSVSRGPDKSIYLSDILLIERPRPGEVSFITAPQGEYRDGMWTFRDPYVFQLKGIDLLAAKPQEDMVINERIVISDLFSAPMPEEQTAAQLRQAIEDGKKLGRNTRMQEVSYHVRYSVPVSCMVFAIVAPVFAIAFARSGGFVGVLLSIVLVFAYYNAFVISTEVLGRTGVLPPWLSAWLPNLIFAALGLLGLRRLE